MEVDPKTMSLDDLIKKDKTLKPFAPKKKGGIANKLKQQK